MDAFEAFYRAKIAQLERELRLAKSEVKRQLILRESVNAHKSELFATRFNEGSAVMENDGTLEDLKKKCIDIL